MDVIVEERGKIFARAHGARLAEIKIQLKSARYHDDADALLTLADALLIYSHSHDLLDLSIDTLLDWLQTFLDFLRCRHDLIKIQPFTPVDGGSTFLMINTPDAPYLVDSLKMLLQRKRLRAEVVSHPILTTKRCNGLLESLNWIDGSGSQESFMLLQVECNQGDCCELAQEIAAIFQKAQLAGQKKKTLEALLRSLLSLTQEQAQRDFIEWLSQGNFIPFGSAVIEITNPTGRKPKANLVASPQGWMPPTLLTKNRPEGSSLRLSQEVRQRLFRSNTLVVEVLDEESPLQHPEKLVYLGFRECCDSSTWREHLFVGLFSQNSINELSYNVLPLKTKLLAALERQQVRYDSYDYQKVLEIFNTFPKVEMFFLDDAALDRQVQSFVALQRHLSVKVVVTRSLSLRSLTLLVNMPSEFYSGETMRRMEAYLARYLGTDDINSRAVHLYAEYVSLHIRIIPQTEVVKIDIDLLEKGLTDLARPWDERLRLLLTRDADMSQGMQLWMKYTEAFPHEYKDLIHPRFAVRDIRAIEQLLESGEEGFDLWGPFNERHEFFRLQFYSLRESCLNELMPFLENLSLTVVDEVDFNVDVDTETVYVKSFMVRSEHPQAKPLAMQRDNLLDILNGLRRGTIEDDYLNRMMLLTGLDWQKIDVFRAYRNYYFQIGNPFTKRRVAFALINNPQAALLLYRYFEARFQPNQEWADPMQREEEALMPVRLELAQALEQIVDINEDRILRSLFNLIDSTVRTNFFLRRNDVDTFLSFKISAIGIIDMPFPRPMYETYVHSASMEGIHLRGGKVARGGIRWSDRPDDFRTEVLGLMKTQMTKNSLIVPVGSKGGFIVKKPFKTREEGAALSRRAYITLMRGLLDLVDNRVSGKLERPAGVVVYDDPDPYLVVAADKGTAHLSDTANGVSLDYGFWLGDAFASGGSVGYDHKRLGITARGAWECVKRHFRESGKDIQTQAFSVVGIGDMSGDVFGNGMLLSQQICLLAAFNHQHIFLDPDPDPALSWQERKRLFELPRSTWADYNPELISRGGGVWERSSKDIPLSKEVRSRLGVRHTSMDGDGLIRQILAAEVELLWNGGIGTYFKCSQEKNADVGDRANDNVRINAAQLRAKVVGEGGNLGFTQPARIEYALAGGMINTDAIDNSAGVDTSDHEVNLKILFQGLREAGVVKSDKTRNRQLLEVQDDVCDMVLSNNYTQSLCLSLDLLRCQEDNDPYIGLAERLANAGLLDPKGEFLPSRKELGARAQGYLRPELSILLAYSKMHLYQTLIESDLPEREPAQVFLQQYFPEKIRQRHGQRLQDHPLRREIIATMITNRVVDQAGCAFLDDLVRQAGASIIQGTAAYLVFDELLGGAAIRQQLFSADNVMATDRQLELLCELEKALAGLCRQVVEQRLPMQLDRACVDSYRERLAIFRAHLAELLPTAEWSVCQDHAAVLVSEGFAPKMALEMASFRYLVGFLPGVYIAEATGAELLVVTAAMSEVRLSLKISQVMESLNAYVAHDRWDRMALSSLRSSFIKQSVKLTHEIVVSGGSADSYFAAKRRLLDYYLDLNETLRVSQPTTTSPYMVLLRALEAVGG